jgi:hypothetical protein
MNGRHARGWGISAQDRTKTITKKTANSIVGKLTARILATGSVAALLLAAPAGAFQAGDGVLVVGDSLEVGSAPYLRPALGGRPVDIDAEGGRRSGEGVRVLAGALDPSHAVVVFPMGTNDLDPDAFAASLGAVRELAGGRCVVVATLTRPAPMNRVVKQFAAGGGVQVADWRSAALTTPGALGRDRVHATSAGYALRANLLAEAVQACLVGGDLSGIPAPEDPNAKPPQREAAPPRRRPPPRPARLPAKAALAMLGSALDRVAAPIASALRDARTAATRAEPEPVLGAR